jgi:mediator of RNA polymerase II transcription subunit 13
MALSSNTPGGDTATDPEPDSSLLNSTDQTWVALVGHRLSISPNATELQPALLSGYLLKRTGPNADETPAVLEVNLVHVDISPRQYETSLREVLSWYSALGTLARARGVVPRDADVRPWHIAAAEKAVRALCLLL